MTDKTHSVTGNLVVCIGQHAVLTGREMKAAQRRMTNFCDPSVVLPLYLFVDDFGISDEVVKKTDYYYRYPKRCSTFFEGFECGDQITEFLMTVLEECDICQSITVLFCADEGLGSGLAGFLVEYISTWMPGLVLFTIGLLPHLSIGGISSVNTVMAMEKCLQYAGCCMLRRMDDTNHILANQFDVLSSKITLNDSVFTEVCRCLAADFIICVTNVQWVLSICSSRSKIVDVRTSMWFNMFKSSQTSSNTSGRLTIKKLDKKEDSHHQSLRNMCINIHSLNVSVPFPEVKMDDPIYISQASLVSVTKTSKKGFADIDFQCSKSNGVLISMLRGATQPRVYWDNSFICPISEAFAQSLMTSSTPVSLPSSKHESSNTSQTNGLQHMSAVCFVSPYAASILRGAADQVALVSEAMAYQCWFNRDNMKSSDKLNANKPRATYFQISPYDQVKLSLQHVYAHILGEKGLHE